MERAYAWRCSCRLCVLCPNLVCFNHVCVAQPRTHARTHQRAQTHAHACRYCMNHFYTNAEKRYCFAAILAPPKPPPSCPPLQPPAHGHVMVPPDSADRFEAGRVKVGFPVHIVCDVDYHVVGSADPKCLADGSYGDVGACVEVVCPPYPAPDHGSPPPPLSPSVCVRVCVCVPSVSLYVRLCVSV